jgi:hypothetical protein
MTEKLRALALAAKPWGINAARQTPEQYSDGEASFGYWDGGDYFTLGTIDTGLYFEPKDALPVAEFIAESNPTNILALLDEIDKLKAENAGLRKDAERLDWMEKNAGRNTVVLGDNWYVRAGLGYPHIKSKNLRSAIDAAKGDSHE